MRDPIRHGFYCVKYEYMEKEMNAVYFNLAAAQEAMMKMMRKGVKCNGLHEIK